MKLKLNKDLQKVYIYSLYNSLNVNKNNRKCITINKGDVYNI